MLQKSFVIHDIEIYARWNYASIWNPDQSTIQDSRVGTPTQFQPPVSYR